MDEKSIGKLDRVLEEDPEQVTGGSLGLAPHHLCDLCGLRAVLYLYNGKGYCGVCFKQVNR